MKWKTGFTTKGQPARNVRLYYLYRQCTNLFIFLYFYFNTAYLHITQHFFHELMRALSMVRICLNIIFYPSLFFIFKYANCNADIPSKAITTVSTRNTSYSFTFATIFSILSWLLQSSVRPLLYIYSVLFCNYVL